jgi:hypothetical protein
MDVNKRIVITEINAGEIGCSCVYWLRVQRWANVMNLLVP